MAKWLELTFNLPLSQSFTYKNIEETGGSLIGKRAGVKFGSRNLIGCIIGESDDRWP